MSLMSNNNRPRKQQKQRRSELFSINVVVVLFLFVLISPTACDRVEILMSNVTTQKDDAYICTSYKLTDSQRFISKLI